MADEMTARERAAKGIQDWFGQAVENLSPALLDHWEGVINTARREGIEAAAKVAEVAPVNIWKDGDGSAYFGPEMERPILRIRQSIAAAIRKLAAP